MEKLKKRQTPTVWAVGGGKGGVGKSIISVFLALSLAENSSVVVVDADLGGANIHTLLGIKAPSRTINDFINRKYALLDDVRLRTEAHNLTAICGASEVLSLSNLQYAQKVKIIQAIFNIRADHVVLDLGAGTSFNVLDFFLAAHRQIVVITPQPVSIQNAYDFVRNAVYRKLSRLTSKNPSLVSIVKTAMDPKNKMQLKTIGDLLGYMAKSGREEDVENMRKEIGRISPAIVTNMTRSTKDKNAGRIIEVVSKKHLMINPVNLCDVAYDQHIDHLVSSMTPLTRLEKSNNAYRSLKMHHI